MIAGMSVSVLVCCVVVRQDEAQVSVEALIVGRGRHLD